VTRKTSVYALKLAESIVVKALTIVIIAEMSLEVCILYVHVQRKQVRALLHKSGRHEGIPQQHLQQVVDSCAVRHT
jgi:hypothetical protein